MTRQRCRTTVYAFAVATVSGLAVEPVASFAPPIAPKRPVVNTYWGEEETAVCFYSKRNGMVVSVITSVPFAMRPVARNLSVIGSWDRCSGSTRTVAATSV